MSKKQPRKMWIETQVQSWDNSFDRYKTRWEITFAISLALFPIPFTFFISDIASEQGGNMTHDPVLSFPSIISMILLYIVLISGFMLIRNANKSDIKPKLDELIDSHNKLTSSQEQLTISINKVPFHFKWVNPPYDSLAYQ